jgi:hypothetical protein
VKSDLGSLRYSDTCPLIHYRFFFFFFLFAKIAFQLSLYAFETGVRIWRGLVLRLALVFFRSDRFFFGGAIFGRGASFLIVCGHGFPNVDCLSDNRL